MTDRELAQPTEHFFQAGIKAFQMRIHSLNNPHKLQPYRGLWLNGYKKAERDYLKANYNRENRDIRRAAYEEPLYD